MGPLSALVKVRYGFRPGPCYLRFPDIYSPRQRSPPIITLTASPAVSARREGGAGYLETLFTRQREPEPR